MEVPRHNDFQKRYGMWMNRHGNVWLLCYYHDVWIGVGFQENPTSQIGYSMTKPKYDSHNAIIMSM